MIHRIIRNDMARNRAIALTTLLFITAAAMLVSLAAVLGVNLAGSIDTLMRQAKTPHFLQMHSGALDSARLAAFAAQREDVEAFQVLEFLNVDGARIAIGERSLAHSVQDNGFVTQSPSFDFLLDLSGAPIQPADGEVYVPIGYMKDGTAKPGDRLTVGTQELRVAGFLRDSQMNSPLSSSKRFLLSENDYNAIRSMGSAEYLIEFRLKDLAGLGALERDYVAAGLEANGPTITHPLFQTINAISDGLVIAVLLLVAALVVSIAFLCIRFTLLAKIEEDYREIGVMKAIGLRAQDIRRIYLAKYAVLAAAGCALGYALSFALQGVLLENIRLYMGESENAALAPILGILGVLLILCAMLAYVRRVLRRFRKISAAEAMRFGAAQERTGGARRMRLSQNRLLPINVLLGVRDVLSRKRLYATLLTVLVISSFIMIVPRNLYSTISSRSFFGYMGIGQCDLRIDVRQEDLLDGGGAEIEAALNRDPQVRRYAALTLKSFSALTQDGAPERIKVELGDHAAFPIACAQGRLPAAQDEIALSVMQAESLGKQLGDPLTLSTPDGTKSLTICGIYSDVTNGGKTAKASFADESSPAMGSAFSVELNDKAEIDRKAVEYAGQFAFAKVASVDVYFAQMFGSTIAAVRGISYASAAAALLITALVTLLCMKLLIAKDRCAIAVMRALGFTGRDIAAQYAARAVFVLVLGIALGALLASTLGEALARLVIGSLGATSFRFKADPLWGALFCPAMMLCALLLATRIGTQGAGRIKISENIKE